MIKMTEDKRNELETVLKVSEDYIYYAVRGKNQYLLDAVTLDNAFLFLREAKKEFKAGNYIESRKSIEIAAKHNVVIKERFLVTHSEDIGKLVHVFKANFDENSNDPNDPIYDAIETLNFRLDGRKFGPPIVHYNGTTDSGLSCGLLLFYGQYEHNDTDEYLNNPLTKKEALDQVRSWFPLKVMTKKHREVTLNPRCLESYTFNPKAFPPLGVKSNEDEVAYLALLYSLANEGIFRDRGGNFTAISYNFGDPVSGQIKNFDPWGIIGKIKSIEKGDQHHRKEKIIKIELDDSLK